MASSYGALVKAERAQLFAQLVVKLTGCEPPDDNFTTATEYCHYHTQYHKFLDSSPSTVRQLYAQLLEKLRVHGQVGKARALGSLMQVALDLTQKNLPPAQVLDRSERILHLLHACAERPLRSPFDRTHAVAVQTRAEALLHSATTGHQAAESDSDSTEFGDVDGGKWGDTSDESDWDCDGSAAREADDSTSPTPMPPLPPSAASSAPFQWDSVLDPACARAESAHTQRADFVEKQPLHQIHAAWVGTEALSGAPHVVTEAELCRAALLALQGVPSAAFSLDADADVFQICTQLRVRHLSSASLLALLDRIAAAATCAQTVRAFGRRVRADPAPTSAVDADGATTTRRGGACGPTLQALAGCLDAELDAVMIDVRSAEQRLCANGAGEVTLLSISLRLSDALAQMRVLALLLVAVYPPGLQPGAVAADGAAAVAAAHVLSELYELVQHAHLASEAGTSASGVGGGALQTSLRVLMATVKPYLDALDAWLREGQLHDPYGEFLVRADPTVAIDSAAFWRDAFTLRRRSTLQPSPSTPTSKPATKDHEPAPGPVVCPTFLRSMAEEVLATGKSLQLLQHSPSTESLHGRPPYDCEEPSARAPDEPLLYDEFLLELAACSASTVAAAGTVRTPPREAAAAVDRRRAREEAEEALARQETKLTDMHGLAVEAPKPPRPWSVDVPVAGAVGGDQPPATATDSLIAVQDNSLLSSSSGLPSVLPQGTSLEPFVERSALGHVHKLSGHDSFSTELPQMRDGAFRFTAAVSDDSDAATVAAIPPKVMLEQCLRRPIERRAVRVGERLMNRLRGGWGLPRELQMLRDIFMGGSADALALFSEGLFTRLSRGDACEDTLELTLLLEESLASGTLAARAPPAISVLVGGRVEPGAAARDRDPWAEDSDVRTPPRATHQRDDGRGVDLGASVERWRSGLHGGATGWSRDSSRRVSPTRNPAAAAGDDNWRDALRQPNITGAPPPQTASTAAEVDIHALASLRLSYALPWPLQMIVDHASLAEYNRVLVFLLTVQRAKFMLDRAPRLAAHALLHTELHHFVSNLQQYCLDGVLLGAAMELKAGLKTANTLDAAIEVHVAFLRAAKDKCFLTPSLLTRSLSVRVVTILQLVLRYCKLCRVVTTDHANEHTGSAAKFKQLAQDFHASHNFLLRVLTSQLRVTHHQHLAHLVTRLNFNEFYFTASDECAFQVHPPPSASPSRPSMM